MVYGFQTSGGSIYVLDPDGRTTRFKRSGGEGQEKWHSDAHCVYLEEAHAGVNLHGPNQKVKLAYAGKDGAAKYFPFKEQVALARPTICDRVSVLVFDKKTDAYVRQIKASPNPKVGLWPLEELHEASGEYRVHRGHTITKVFDTVADLKMACKAAGLNQIPLPIPYVEEWKALSNSASLNTQPQKLPSAAKLSFVRNIALQGEPPIENDPKGVMPAMIKSRPRQSFIVTK